MASVMSGGELRNRERERDRQTDVNRERERERDVFVNGSLDTTAPHNESDPHDEEEKSRDAATSEYL